MLDLIRKLCPPHWTVEDSRTYGIVISSSEGSVTVDPKMRNFESGCCPVRKRGEYKGRGWQAALAAAAIARAQEHESFWIARHKSL